MHYSQMEPILFKHLKNSYGIFQLNPRNLRRSNCPGSNIIDIAQKLISLITHVQQSDNLLALQQKFIDTTDKREMKKVQRIQEEKEREYREKEKQIESCVSGKKKFCRKTTHLNFICFLWLLLFFSLQHSLEIEKKQKILNYSHNNAYLFLL